MIGSELDAAGVRDPSLREAFRQCREINARDGKTFFLATRLLAPSQRPAVLLVKKNQPHDDYAAIDSLHQIEAEVK